MFDALQHDGLFHTVLQMLLKFDLNQTVVQYVPKGLSQGSNIFKMLGPFDQGLIDWLTEQQFLQKLTILIHSHLLQSNINFYSKEYHEDVAFKVHRSDVTEHPRLS